jgi:hypothetical protein
MIGGSLVPEHVMARFCLVAGLGMSFVIGLLSLGPGPALGVTPGQTIGLLDR